MATIIPRKNKAGQTRYTAQIRIKRGGVRHSESKTFGSEKAAARWWHARMHELEQPGALKRAAAGGATVGELIQRYIDEFAQAGRYGRTKMFDLAKLLKEPISAIPADTLTSADYVAHIRHRLESCGPATAGNDLIRLRTVFKTARPAWGVDVDLQALDDAAELCRKHGLIKKGGRRDGRPTLEQLDALLEFFSDRDGRAHIPMVDVTLFALFSGRRQDEITHLRWDDLDRKTPSVLVRDMKDPRHKKGNDVTCGLTPEALAIIDRQEKSGPLIFPYNSKSVGAAFTRACRMCEIEGLVFHQLRHECISWLIERHLPVPQVSFVSGHKSWATLQRYTHLRATDPVDKYAGWKWRPQSPR